MSYLSLIPNAWRFGEFWFLLHCCCMKDTKKKSKRFIDPKHEIYKETCFGLESLSEQSTTNLLFANAIKTLLSQSQVITSYGQLQGSTVQT